MREKIISMCAYGIVLIMVGAIAFIFGLLSRQLKTEIIFKDKVKVIKEDNLVCPPTLEREVKIIYQDRIIPVTKTVFKEKIVIPPREKIHYGFSLVGASLKTSPSEKALGLGVSVREGSYRCEVGVLNNKSVLFSLGYEF